LFDVYKKQPYPWSRWSPREAKNSFKFESFPSTTSGDSHDNSLHSNRDFISFSSSLLKAFVLSASPTIGEGSSKRRTYASAVKQSHRRYQHQHHTPPLRIIIPPIHYMPARQLIMPFNMFIDEEPARRRQVSRHWQAISEGKRLKYMSTGVAESCRNSDPILQRSRYCVTQIWVLYMRLSGSWLSAHLVSSNGISPPHHPISRDY
jgi:hypothetical protein